MRLTNTTDLPAAGLRRMLGWVCREIGFPASGLRRATVKPARTAYSGLAIPGRSVILRLGPAACYPCLGARHRGWEVRLADRWEGLVFIAAHEIGHLDHGRRRVQSRRTPAVAGPSWGGSEEATNRLAAAVLNAYRARAAELLLAWGLSPAEPAPARQTPAAASQCPPAGPSPLVRDRAARAAAAVARWERKLKFARTMLAKARAKDRYYQRKLGRPAGEGGQP